MNSIAAIELGSHAYTLLCSLGAPALEPFLADWPSAESLPVDVGDGPEAQPRPTTSLPVLRFMAEVTGRDGNFGTAMIGALGRHAEDMAWRQSYTADEVGEDFLHNYGYVEALGYRAPVPATRIACGFLLLGPSTLYPRHRHEAEEIYLPLSGTARWQQGDGQWRERQPGTLVHHRRWEPHAMHTGEEPLLALYVWHSENLNQKARLDSKCGT